MNKPKPCECPAAGFCSRYQKRTNERTWKACQEDDEYRALWDSRVSPEGRALSEKRQAEAMPPGVGTELQLIIASWVGKKQCWRCHEHVKEMNNRGVEWCRENQELILDWLHDGAKRHNLPFIRIVAKLWLKQAIKRAESK